MMQDQVDMCHRDDILIFSEALSKSTHNIKSIQNYRKSHNNVLKRNEPTECTNDHAYVWTIDNSERVAEHQSQQKMKINLNSLPVRRASVTAGNSRRKNHEGFKTQARTLNLSNNISTREQPTISLKKVERKENKFATIEKKYNKGPLKDKYLACWLNSLLLEACQDEKFDAGAENPALKKYNLDENSLRSKGIRPENMTRIYKSLFVYSIGFNDLLREICETNMNLRKTIWKVFAILLEYCAQGDFEMMIAQIERDKLAKVENLTNEILKRQKIIQNNEEINERKNAKIYKEIKQLRDDNLNLQNQKQALLEEFKQAEQAFNQEVALRLRYENKINQIHGVYTQIQNKHSRLLYDHGEAQKELDKLRTLTSNQNKLVTDLRKDNEHKGQQIQLLQKDAKFKFEMIGFLESKKHGDAHQNIENINIIKDLKMVIEQKNRQILQLNITLNNTNLIFETQKLEHQQTSQSLAASLQENSKLHGTIQEQMRDLNELLLGKRNFGIKTSEVQAETALIVNKLNQKTKQLKNLTQRVEDLEQESRKLKVEVEIQKKLKLEHLQSLRISHENIRDMKVSKNLIQQENDERKRKMETIDEILQEKDNKIREQTQIIDAQNQQISSCKQSLKVLESKNEILNEKVKSSEQIYAKKISILRNEKETIEKQYLEFNNMRRILELERDKLREQYEASQLSFKNQKFQRANLKIYYDNSLNTGKQKNEAIKNLDIQISELNEELSETKRKIKNNEFLAHERESQLKKQKDFWMQRANNLIKQGKQRKFYVHPMVHEDVCENYRIFKAKYEQLQMWSQSKIKHLQEFIQKKQLEIKQMIKVNQQKTHAMIKKYEAIVERKENQLHYEASKNAHLTETNKDLELNLRKYTGDGRGEMSFEREERYLVDIKQKKQQIDILLKDLQAVQDANKNLKESYLNFEIAIPQKEKELKQLKHALTETKQHYKQIVQQKDTELLQKQEQINALRELERTNSNTKNDGTARPSKSKQLARTTSGNRNDSSGEKRQINMENDTKRNDFARKYKGAYIYYAK